MGRAEPDRDQVQALTDVLIRGLRGLGDAGHTDQAARLAARAWSLTRTDHPRAADRLNGLLHYLTRPRRAATSRKETDMTTANAELDVREEIPARRHDLIFQTYHALAPGDSFVLVNDHDPKPLYYQFAAEHDGRFSWDYIEQGPQVWRVRIGRTN